MREGARTETSFPTARCAACARTVLTYVDFDDLGERRRCVHCDAVVVSDLRWIGAPELADAGYEIAAPRRAGGCGSGGCGSGGCATRKG